MTEVTSGPAASSGQFWPRRVAAAETAQRLTAWTVALLLAVYLGLSGGGYDIVVRSEIGLVVWWFLLLGVLIGVLPRTRIGPAGWAAAALLAGFLLWSWLGLDWSRSHERTLDEVCRLSTYLGVFLLGLSALSGATARPLVNGLGCGIAAVCGVAILSKLTPGLFPADTARHFYATPRLSYPFDYADGVGEYAALGLPLVLFSATSARTVVGRAAACTALLPVLLCIAMTVSRGGILAGLVGTVVFLALAPDRIPRLPTLAIAAMGISVLMVALLHRPALRDSLSPAPAAQRHSMLLLIGVVMAAAGAVQAGLQLVMRRRPRPSWLFVSRRAARGASVAILVGMGAVVIGAVVGGTAGHLWHDFKLWEPAKHSNQYFRLLSLAGSHRYQYWQVAWQAFSNSPVHGIGAGMFRFYWDRHTTHGEFVLNAHSLWFETLAETGVVGAFLLVAFFALIAIGGAARALRSPGDQGTLIATAVAGVCSFCAAASFDWVWQIGVVPMVALLLAAVSVLPDRARDAPARAGDPPRRLLRSRALALRGAVAGACVVALVLIAIPLSSTIALRSSQAAAAADHLAQALRSADTALAIEPGSASPYLQRALILEQADEIGAAGRQIAAAIVREPDNYVLWMTASRIATEAGHPKQALRDYRHARTLYPTSTYFLG